MTGLRIPGEVAGRHETGYYRIPVLIFLLGLTAAIFLLPTYANGQERIAGGPEIPVASLFSGDIEFEKIPTPGVSNTLMEDRDGFVWIGTDVGLWRYDGYGFKSFSHIVPERIDAGMYQDEEGTIWIGTENGLIAFDPLHESRITYTHDPEKPGTISNHVFQYKKHAFCEDESGRLWVATDDGLNMFDRKNERFKAFDRKKGGLIDNYITAILASRDGMIWVATFRGLQKFDPIMEKVISYYPGAPKNMYALAEDSSGKLWIGAYLDGLHTLDPVTGKFTAFRHDEANPESLSSDIVTFILIPETQPELIWVTTFDGGLNIIESSTGIIHTFRADPECPQKKGLSGNALSHIIRDRMGAFFVLNEHGFLNRIDPGAKRFITLMSSEAEAGAVPLASAYSVWDDAGGNVWMVAGKNRVSRYEPEAGEFIFVRELPADIQGMIASDRTGAMWLAGNGYIAEFDPGLGGLTESIEVKGLRLSGLRDRTNTDILWIGSANAGLIRVDTVQRIVNYLLPEKKNGGPDGNGQMAMRLILAQDRDGMIWVSTFGVGLQSFDPSLGKITGTYAPSNIRPGNPSGFFRDSKDRVWVSFQNAGPARFDPDTGIFRCFDELYDISWPARGSTGILEDGEGILWISGNGSGEIVRFNPDTAEVRLYTTVDGVAPGTSDTLNRQPVIGSDGAFWFSGMGGVTRFFPEDIKDNLYKPPVYLTELSQDGIPLDVNGNIRSRQKMILPPDKNFFDFQAVALNFRLSERNQYRYRLLGRDEKWVDAGTTRQGHYSGLEEGMYILEVLGANNDGVWSEKPARLNIYVQPRLGESMTLFSLREIEEGKVVTMEHSRNNLVFEAAPLDFSILEDRDYLYKLDGYDFEWRTIGSSRFINYRKIPQGRYTFRVLNTETKHELSLPVVISPPVYKSWWFVTIMLLIVFTISASFYRQRVTHLKREKEEAVRHQYEEGQLEKEKLKAIDDRLAAVVERENAVEALRKSEKRHRDLLETMTEGFVIFNHRGLLTYGNNRFYELVGYSPKELEKNDLSSLLEGESRQHFLDHMKEPASGRTATYELEWNRKDGKKITTLLSSRPVFDSSGVLLESFAVITDISRLKETEAILRSREQEVSMEKDNLEEVNTALKVLLQKREEAVEEVKGSLQLNLKKLVLPYLEKVDTRSLSEQQAGLLRIVSENLENITSEFTRNLGARYAELSNTEIQVANLIRDGQTTKEIAGVLNISERTVEFHRSNIRKKLGIKGNTTNLQSYLQKF